MQDRRAVTAARALRLAKFFVTLDLSSRPQSVARQQPIGEEQNISWRERANSSLQPTRGRALAPALKRLVLCKLR